MYAQVEKPKENRRKSVANSVVQNKSEMKQGFEFVDNRPNVVVQKRKQEQAVQEIPSLNHELTNNKQVSHNEVTQRVIHYKKKGKWSDRSKLINQIADYFNANEEQIEIITADVKVDESKEQESVWDADGYYLDYIDHAIGTYNWAPPFQKVSGKNSHGPQLPIDANTKNPKVSVKHSSENTFTWPSKTMGNVQVIVGNKVVFETIKYSDNGVHAENQMIPIVNAFVKSNSYKWSDVKLRITINNFPCDHNGKHCGKLIAAWAKEVKMREIHIYYANKYEGPPEGFKTSWEAMKSCGIPINLTPFKAEEYLENTEFGVRAQMKFKPEAPTGKKSDPFSDSEDESMDELDSKQMELDISKDEIKKLIMNEFLAVEFENESDREDVKNHTFDEDLLSYAIKNGKSKNDIVFLYTDIYDSMHS